MIGVDTMKKGFTLIELLAVIVILSIILAIAIPRIIGIVDNVRINAAVKNEQMFLKAAKNYVAANDSVLPTNIGDTSEITLNQLQSANIVGMIKSPHNGSNECNGYVLVTKVGDNSFNYIPHLNCNEDIGSTISDGLVAHYTFDDFQEPTQNLLINPLNMTNGWHHIEMVGASDSENFFRFTETVANNSHIVGQVFTTEANAIYTQSCYVRKLDRRYIGLSFTSYTNWTGGSGGHTYFDLDLGSIHSHVGTGPLDSGIEHISDGIYRIWISALSSDVVSSRLNLFTYQDGTFVQFPGDVTKGVYVKECQLEKKPYPSPFVDGIRDGIVKDYSLSNNHVTLALGSTPTWTNEAKMGDGAYQFDGINDYFTVSQPLSFSGTNSFSISGWINPNTGSSRFICPYSAGLDHYIGYNSSSQRLMVTIAEAGDLNERTRYSTTNSVPINNWTHFVVTINNLNVRIYINGELNAEYNETIPIALWSGNWDIGRRPNGTYFYSGKLDDIRIYNRVLSNDEIKMYYVLQNNK